MAKLANSTFGMFFVLTQLKYTVIIGFVLFFYNVYYLKKLF